MYRCASVTDYPILLLIIPPAEHVIHLASQIHGSQPSLAVFDDLFDAEGALIEMRDAAGARALMDDHVKMIRARRVAEHGAKDAALRCC